MNFDMITFGVSLVNLLLGGMVWLMRQAYLEIKDEQKLHKIELDKVKDTYFKKEDFKEFKDELWTRLDKLENHWAEKLNNIK